MLRVIVTQNAIYFIILSSSVPIILRLFITHMLKFTYQPRCLKVEYPYMQQFFVFLSTETITVMKLGSVSSPLCV